MKKVVPLIFALCSVYVFMGCKNNTDTAPKIKTEKDDAQAGLAEALEFEFEITKDPATGKIPDGIHALEMDQARAISDQNLRANRVSANNYFFQGPDNLGGRTRSVVFDVRYNGTTNQVMMAAGVSGGVWKSIDGGNTWLRKSPTNVHYSCTSIAQDPRVGQQNVWYYSTGEPSGNSANATGASYSGNGIYKSQDNGETWTRLANSNTSAVESFSTNMDYILKVQVNPTDGAVYAAALAAIYRSTDGGTTWGIVLSGTLANSGQTSDVIITPTGRLYAGFSGTNTNTVDGVWTSTTGDLGSWLRIAGTGAVANPATWNAQNGYGRVVLALTPSNENIVYAMYYRNFTSSCTSSPAPETEFFRWNLATSTWTDLSANLPDEAGCSNGNDPFAVQTGYDMVIAVHPTNPNLVVIGGTNAYRSLDGFTTNLTTTRIGGYAGPTNYSQYTNSHPDIHAFAFLPTNPNVMFCGNDGGVQRTDNINAPIVSWTVTSNGFRTYQYYYVALDPRVGNQKVIGGAQDNGTTRNIGGTGVLFESVLGGDGVSVALSNEIGGSTYEYGGSQQGSITRRNSTSLPNFGSNIRPATAASAGLFVTLFHLDPDNSNTLYYVNTDTIYRTTSASTVTTTTWGKLTGIADLVSGNISALATTRGVYTTNSNLYFGNSAAKVFRLTDPANVDLTTAPVDITGSNFPAAGYVSSVSVNPRNDDTVLVTFSNYGVNSAYWTGNAKSATPTWVNVEGNLNLPSYRTSIIAIVNEQVEYYVGTSVGLYKATINGANPTATTWVQEAAGEIGNAVVDDLKLRPADNNLLIGTHGYGMWKAVLDPSSLPVTFSRFAGVAERNYNALTWTVETEINSKGYSIERRYKDQVFFSPIGYVSSRGDGNNSLATYSFKDLVTDLSSDQSLYRLKQEDKDGKYKYSPVVTINRKPSSKLVEYISANRSTLLIRMNNITSEKLSVRITDLNGRQLIRQDVNAGTQQIPISQLSSGAYLVEILMGNERMYLQKFIK